MAGRVLVLVRALSTAAASAAPSRTQQGPPSNKAISVAIIGGGMAGLSCAECLASSADENNKLFDVTVFDTGRLRPGGRCSSRQAGDPPKKGEEHQDNNPILSQYRYDHAAQILAVPPLVDNSDSTLKSFAQQVAQWEQAGTITEFPKGSVFNIRSHKRMDVLNDNDDDDKSTTTRYYYGTHGMGSIPQAMVQQSGGRFRLHQDVWVSPSNGVKYLQKSKQWRVQAAGQVWGTFDRLVIAHNGKCADRLMSRTPARDLHKLLRVNFSSAVAASGGNRMTLNSLYSLTFAIRRQESVLSRQLPAAFVAGSIANHPALRFLTCQTRKYYKKNNADDDDSDDDIEVWTVLSSPTFAKKHKAPQEFLPSETVETVTQLLLRAAREAVTGKKMEIDSDESATIDTAFPVLDARLQLWGAAVPLNVWCCSASESSSSNSHTPAGFLYDAEFGVGACGDWLVEPSLAGAWASGRRLARHMVSTKQESSHGLRGDGCAFQKSAAAASAGIGALSVAPSIAAATTKTTNTGRTPTSKTPWRTRQKSPKRRAVAKAASSTN